ncbi:MAG: hypothetical protein JSR47_00055 [Proteobacteria bacterium]|nr:hypothetical protein [Pseudomonadota bacterium]
MARSSTTGSRRTTAWAIDQKPRSLPRVVRLGRAANDNARQPGGNARLFVAALGATLAILAVCQWWPR